MGNSMARSHQIRRPWISSIPGKSAYHVEQLVKVLVVPAELQMVVSPDHALGRMELKRKSRPKLDKRLK